MPIPSVPLRLELCCLATALLIPSCTGQKAPIASAPGSAVDGTSGAGSESPGAVGSGTEGSTPSAMSRVPAAPLPGGEEPTPDKALPELRIEPLGMHVGGGTNDAAEKAPFHRALERQFPAFLECYRLVEDPWSGGSFGIDLKIPRAGGPPSIEQPRTKLHGTGFQQCMVSAFGKVQFERPKAGPTVISYSVRFTLGKGKP